MMDRVSRREFLKQSIYFSAAHLLAKGGLHAQEISRIDPEPGARHLFAFGDWGEESSQRQQRAVAEAMQSYARWNDLHVESLLMLGDNWYGWLFDGSKSSRWRSQFEERYPESAFPGKCYAILGNHDYEHRPGSKVDAQLEYAKGKTRWTMPAKWYSFDFPEVDPLIRFIALDSNYPHGEHLLRTPTLNEEEVNQQNVWLKSKLEEARKAPFTSIIAHHPIFSNGDHGDTHLLIRDWQPLLEQYRIPLYLSGHDHDLQHLEFDGKPTSYVISGGGGATLRDMKISASTRGPYGVKVAGFTHLQVTEKSLTIRHVGETGRVLHGFGKSRDGIVTLL